MHAPEHPHVEITEHGRSGTVVYREPAGGLSFYWEFGGGDVVVCINVGTEADWRREHAWAVDRRDSILRFVGNAVVERKAPTCTAEIDEASGWMNLRQGTVTSGSKSALRSSPAAPQAKAREEAAAWMRRYSKLRMKLGLVVLGGALILAGLMWFKMKVLVIDPGKGTAVGSSVRTDQYIATLIQTLEPYTPSLNRNHGNDTYRYSLFLVPLDGSDSKLIPIGGGFSPSAMGLAQILGSDGRTLWFNVNGVGGVDLGTHKLVAAGKVPEAGVQLQGASDRPIALMPDAFICAGLMTSSNEWLGLHSDPEVGREFAPGKFMRRVERQEDAKQMRRLYRAELDAPVDNTYYKIISMTPLGDEKFLNAAFLRIDDASEPLRLTDPDGSLMIHTSAPGLKGTLMVARVDNEGHIQWRVDTAIDRFKLQQILPGETAMAFVGTRPPVPDKVSEPLLVIVDNATGAMVTHSLWR
ncbi:MAG: hypothetical protein IPP26_00225 [Flavobacteriales bacterium]|nr:hypothetical protein [Flavobacteriales bacterium]